METKSLNLHESEIKEEEGIAETIITSGQAKVVSSKPKARFELSCYESSNALLHILFNQRQYEDCKVLINDLLNKYNGRCEYALFLGGLIARIEGDLDNALQWFEKAFDISGQDPQYLKEIGRVYFLLGKHKSAIEHLEKAVKENPKDSGAYYWLANSISKLDTELFHPLEKARDLLCQAPILTNHSHLVEFLGYLQAKLGDYSTAIQAYNRALELEPENEKIMLQLGILHLKNRSDDPAFSVFGRALTYNPTNPHCILGIGSVMQRYGDHDVALNKYRVAAQICDYNGFLWNNIAVCLFARGKLAASHSCLKKAAYMCPLNYKINYNLGLVHLAMDLNASAHHFLKAALDLNKENAQLIGAYAVALAAMKDARNARRAYIRALTIDSQPQTLLNFALFAHASKEDSVAITMLKKLEEVAMNHPNGEEYKRQANLIEDKLQSNTK